MSIFQESFPKHVDRQLQIREAILKHGNTNSRFGSPNLKLKDGKVRIKPGAFYTNTIERQCTIRMSSGVDIKGLSNPAELFVLEGGVPKKEGGQREGFTTGNRKSNVYGSKEIFSDAGDDFGIVPMPGIVDANIRTKSAYGSLREAQVNFVCHNRRQLEILERLYMRPGFPILLEWQWSPYIDNDGNIQKRVKTLSSKGGIFWDKTSTYEKIQEQIHKFKKQTGGNYDGFIGICKNFDFKATPAGGYECTTEIISTGEIIDGIKGKREGFKLRVEGEEEERELDNFEYFLEAIKQYAEVYTLQNEEKTKKTNDIFKANASLFQSFQKLANNVNPGGARLFEAISDDQLEELRQKEKVAKASEESKQQYRRNYYQANDAKARTKEGKDYQAEISRIENLLDKFIIRKGEVVSVNNDIKAYKINNQETGSPKTYIRWDFLAHIMNQHVLEEYKEDENIAEITWVKKVEGQDDTYIYLDYVASLPTPEVSIPRDQDEKGRGIDHFPLNSILGISFDPSKCLLPHQINKFMLNETKEYKGAVISKGEIVSASDFSIGNIFFSVTYLLELYGRLRYNEDGTLNEGFRIMDFLKKLWEEEANAACAGAHNFMVHHDKENTSHIRIIDLIYQANGLQPENLYEFHIQDNNTIVRDFSFNSTIPSSLVSTMAVTAQDPRSIGDIESVTAASLNKDLTCRFSSFNNAYDPTEENIQARKDKEREVIKSARKLRKYNINSLTGYYNKPDEDDNNPDYTSVQQAMKNYKTLIDLVEWLQSRYPLTDESEKEFKIDDKLMAGALRKNIKSDKSSIIPLKFTCLLDGIGGIIIGNVFKVDKKRLPIGYQGKDIAFIVHGESQTITSGQDWTTEISGQLILLDIAQDEKEMTGVVISPGDIAIKGSDLEGEDSPTPNADIIRLALANLDYIEKGNRKLQKGKRPQLATYGDVSEEIKDAIISILVKIKEILPNIEIKITGGNDRQSKTSRHAQGNGVDFVIEKIYDPRDNKLKKFRPLFEEVYGNVSSIKKIIHNKNFKNKDLDKLAISYEGNDAPLKTNIQLPNTGAPPPPPQGSNDTDGGIKRAIDQTIATIDSILKGFVGASSAEGRLRYLNEYHYITSHATGPHFHISYGPPNASEGGPSMFTSNSQPYNYTGRKDEDGIDNLTLSQRTVNEKLTVWLGDKWTNVPGFTINSYSESNVSRLTKEQQREYINQQLDIKKNRTDEYNVTTQDPGTTGGNVFQSNLD